MQINMKKQWRYWAIFAIIAIGSAAGSRLLDNFRFFQILNLKSLDTHFVVRGSQPTSKIILVVADEKALKKFEEPLIFWHLYYAAAIRAARAAGAKVIGLDHAFGIPVAKWEADFDRALAAEVSTESVPVICGYVTSLNTNQDRFAVPINMTAAGLGLSAFSNLTADPDDFVRRQELIEDSKSDPEKSFSLRVTEKYLQADAKYQNGRLTLAGYPVPISPEGSIYINYAGPPGTYPRISLADVVEFEQAGQKDQLRALLNGKIVLIGADSLDDRHSTPFYTLFQGPKWTTAGVEIHANTISTLLNRDYLLPVPAWLRIAGLLFATTVTAAIATSAAAGTAAIWLVLEALAILGLTHLLFRAGWILSTSEMLSASIFCLIAAVVYRFATAEKRGNLFRKAISLFVGRQLTAALEDTETIRLSGKRDTVTILFTDIRGFTSFTEHVSEEQGPEVVVQLLNEYLAAMVSIIVRYHGHVNKFLGDGILAVFSDDDEGAIPGDHAIRSVRCAYEMVTAPSRFSTGAGIHTGVVVVGNVGSADKMEYTVLGDAVNLASRIESLNKEHHTRLLMSEATQSLLLDEVETTHLGTTQVRGKAVPINLYTVTSLIELPKAVVNA